MKRLVVAAGLVAGLTVAATPASAAIVGGKCDGKVDVACQEHPCTPEYPCNIEICLVWYGSECLSN